MPPSIDSLSATAAVASLIRRAMGERSQSRQRLSSTGQKGKTVLVGSKSPQTPLANVIATRVEELDPDASDFRSRILRLVIEAALLQQFGHALINAPKFQGMVDQVLHDLQAAPQLRPDVSALLDGLTGHPQGNPFT